MEKNGPHGPFEQTVDRPQKHKAPEPKPKLRHDRKHELRELQNRVREGPRPYKKCTTGCKNPPPFVPSIAMIGDAVGIKGVGRNFIVNVGLSNPALWCKDPSQKPEYPLPANMHPSLKLAFNARYINFHIDD